MRICLLADATSIHTIKICDYLIKKNHEIFVISFQQGHIEGVKVIAFNEINLRSRSDLSKTSYLSYIIKIKKMVNEIKPDILHAHYASSYGTIGSLINYRPYVLSIWGSDVYIFPNKSKIHEYLLRFNLSRADAIMSTSKAMANEVKKYTKKNVYVTPFGVDFCIFNPLTKISKDKVIKIGITKTLNTIYGIDTLIEAFKIACDELKDEVEIKLFIAGKGEHEKKLKDLVNKLNLNQKVEFLGFLNRQEVVEFYHMIDFAAFPSISESFGVSAIEAQACGIPVIVSDVGGLTEVTEPGVTSIVVPSKNIDMLAKGIIELAKNEELRKLMGQKAYEYVRKKYDVQENFKRIEEIYFKITTSEWKV
jgi:glycosyltransferase involved in cell wall biosynthesis